MWEGERPIRIASADADADAFREADVIITMLPQGKVVREAMLGREIDTPGSLNQVYAQ